jgi:hypothetical protein
VCFHGTNAKCETLAENAVLKCQKKSRFANKAGGKSHQFDVILVTQKLQKLPTKLSAVFQTSFSRRRLTVFYILRIKLQLSEIQFQKDLSPETDRNLR